MLCFPCSCSAICNGGRQNDAPFLTAAFAAAIFLSATSVQAQIVCVPRSDVLAHLAKKYHEAPVAIGVTSAGALVEVLTTGDGATWTIIVTGPNGLSCLVAAGEGWRTLSPTTADPET